MCDGSAIHAEVGHAERRGREEADDARRDETTTCAVLGDRGHGHAWRRRHTHRRGIKHWHKDSTHTADTSPQRVCLARSHPELGTRARAVAVPRSASCMRLTASDAPAASSGALVQQGRVQLVEAHASRRRAARGASRAAARSRASPACRGGGSRAAAAQQPPAWCASAAWAGCSRAPPDGHTCAHVPQGGCRRSGTSSTSRTQLVLECVTCGAGGRASEQQRRHSNFLGFLDLR